MDFLTAAGHLFHFSLPALCLAGIAVCGGGLVMPAQGAPWPRRLACDFLAGLAVLVAGLVGFGHDGKMATWLALVVAVSASEWLMRGGWRR